MLTSEKLREYNTQFSSAVSRGAAEHVSVQDNVRRVEDDIKKTDMTSIKNEIKTNKTDKTDIKREKPDNKKGKNKKNLVSKLKNKNVKMPAEPSEYNTKARKITEYLVPKPKNSGVPASNENFRPESALSGSSLIKTGILPTRIEGDSENLGDSENVSVGQTQPSKGINNSGI